MEQYLGRLETELAGARLGRPDPGHAVERRRDDRRPRAAAGRSTSSSRGRRPASSPTAALARRIGRPNAISVDMGGTTAKASVVEDYQIQRAGEFEIGGNVSQGSRINKGSGFLLRVPAIDIAEIGAGGGSIVRVDDAGQLHVGPRSAGAIPGPACYANGGTEATLTDANVVPRLPPRRAPAERAAARRRAGPAGGDRPGRDPARAVAPRRRPRRVPARLRPDGARRPGRDRRARPRPARVRDRRVRRQRAAVRGRDGGRPRRSATVIVPPAPGRVQRGRAARGRPRAPPRPDVHATAGRGDARPRRRRRVRARSRPRRASSSPARPSTGAIELTRCVDLRYAGQSYELTIAAARPTRDPRRRLATPWSRPSPPSTSGPTATPR